jgi:hypothetical protein
MGALGLVGYRAVWSGGYWTGNMQLAASLTDMRTIITALVCFSCLTAYSQSKERIEVVQAPGSAVELYRRAERWFVDAFRDADEVLQLRDSVTHTLVGKGASQLYWTHGKGLNMTGSSTPFRFSFEVTTKDGRYRVRVYDATMNSVPCYIDTVCYAVPTEGSKRLIEVSTAAHDQVCAQAVALIDALIASLKAAMLKPAEDW